MQTWSFISGKEGNRFIEDTARGVLGSKGIGELRSSTSALHHALEESASLLTVFWRAALPSTHIPVLPGKVGESTERELLELRTKVSKQGRLLQSTAERLKTANQQKESMEQFIVSQRRFPEREWGRKRAVFPMPHLCCRGAVTGGLGDVGNGY
ncbi:hypothetical protein H8959_019337 [Pygathrix nigripes]